MKQVRQNYRTGELAVADVPSPHVGDGSVLVATRASLISSGTERQLIELAKASLLGKAAARPDLVRRVLRDVRRIGLRPTLEKVFSKLDTPIPLGYSLAGEALKIGRGAEEFRVGERVACAGAGFANHAEINVVPKNLVVRIPDGVDDEDASFVTLGAIALQGVRQTQPTLGERVVVMGLGLLGLLTVQLLKANGCRVLGVDPDVERAEHARRLGADVAVCEDALRAVDGFTGGWGADAVIVTASAASSEPLNLSAECCRLKGRVILVGLVGMNIDREIFYKRELDLRLSMSYGPGRHDPSYEVEGHDYPLPYVRWTERRNMEAFLDLVAQGKVTPKALVTHRFAIDDALEAYRMIEAGEKHLAVALTYPRREAPIDAPPSVASTLNPASGVCALGFIGFGNYAKSLLAPAFARIDGVSFARVAAASGLSAAHAAQKFGFAAAADTAQQIFDDASIDAVVVATRHDTHAAYVRSALAAGKHVFVEKPLALSFDELDAVAESARTAPGVLTVGFNRRFAPLLCEMKAAFEPRLAPLVMIYRVNAGEIPASSWIQRREGGGRIVGEMCHFVDALSFLCGAPPTDVQAVAARGRADAVSALLRFADGSTGTIVYSSLGDAGVEKEYVEVFGAGCVARLHDFARLDISRGGRTRKLRRPQDKGQSGLVRAFVAATRGAAAPISLSELIAVSEATLLIDEAVRGGVEKTIGDAGERAQ